MSKNVIDLLIAESKRAQELVEIIEASVIPPYDDSEGWSYEQNQEHYEKKALVKQAKSELKQRLKMLRKDCMLVIKDIEKER